MQCNTSTHSQPCDPSPSHVIAIHLCPSQHFLLTVLTPLLLYGACTCQVVPYLLSTCVIGVFMLVGLRKLMIIDYALTFPSGTATGLMIDSFFTKRCL